MLDKEKKILFCQNFNTDYSELTVISDCLAASFFSLYFTASFCLFRQSWCFSNVSCRKGGTHIQHRSFHYQQGDPCNKAEIDWQECVTVTTILPTVSLSDCLLPYFLSFEIVFENGAVSCNSVKGLCCVAATQSSQKLLPSISSLSLCDWHSAVLWP